MPNQDRKCLNCGDSGVIAKSLCWKCYQYKRRNGVSRPTRLTLLEAFHASVTLHDGCWLWNGRLAGKTPMFQGKNAYTFAWTECADRKIRPGFVVANTCGNFRCVNPQHLKQMTRAELHAKTHCENGHVLNPETTVLWGGIRHCGLCAREFQKQLRKNRRKPL